MKNFDFKRMTDMARWDLNTNRQTYQKYAMVIVGLYVVMAMYTYVVGWMTSAAQQAPFFDGVDALAATMCTVFGFQTIYAMSTMFNGLHTRQGRVNELMLPATNKEKFLWHVVRIFAGNIAFFALGVILADLVHVLFIWMVYGFSSNVCSITLAVMVNEYGFVGMNSILPFASGVEDTMVKIGLNFLCYAFVATFAFGSAWKYRNSFATTVLFHIVFWLGVFVAGSLIMGIFMAALNPFSFQFFDLLSEIRSWFWAFVFMLFGIAVFLGLWYATYKVYCSAQITTRRNP